MWNSQTRNWQCRFRMFRRPRYPTHGTRHAKAIGYTGHLNRASIYKSRIAGEKLKKMMSMGQSRPWPEALEALTGEKEIDASAIVEYFAPLKKWLDEQNKGNKVGW